MRDGNPPFQMCVDFPRCADLSKSQHGNPVTRHSGFPGAGCPHDG